MEMGTNPDRKLDLGRLLYQPGDDEEIMLSKRVWFGIATSSCLLGLIALAVYWWLSLEILVFLMAGFSAFFLVSIVLFLRVRNRIEAFFVTSEVFKILFSFVAVILTGGILTSGGFVFIGFAGIIFSLVFPRPEKARFILLLYLTVLTLEAILQPILRPVAVFSPEENRVLFVLYFMASLMPLYAFVRAFMRERMRFRQLETEKLRALDAARSRFFSNISHEFRTPLTVILGMADKIRAEADPKLEDAAHSIRRNGRKLLRLVEQLLDLSRLEAGALEAHYEHADVIAQLKYLLESFHSVAEGKGICLQFSAKQEELWMDIDAEKMEHLVGNLLDNAIKFTPQGGKVELSVEMFSGRDVSLPGSAIDLPGRQGERADLLPFENFLLVAVRDTGIGIPPEHQSRIFDRYYRVGEWPTEGAGIGLAMAREYARLFGGAIEVASQPGEGSAFFVFLPIRNQAPRLVSVPGPAAPEREVRSSAPKALEKTASRSRLLLIEDNEDVIRYLSQFLEKTYDLIAAHDGEEGINLALSRVPDIIISDIMMPKKDGLEVCRTLKADFRTNHIPIILLTAKSDRDSRVRGLECGADAYLAKPFDRKELEVELETLLKLRETLRRKYQHGFVSPLPENKPSGLNERFLFDLRRRLETHYQEETFGIKALCAQMGISRTQLHRKLIALTNKPASHFIRSFRLEKARELLRTTRMTVAEVAYAVGFKDPLYFSRVFSRQFGLSPSEARQEK